MAELLTTKQLQQILQVDRTTIYRMAESGRIPAIKVGNQWRFPRQQIEAWLWQRNARFPITTTAEPVSQASDMPTDPAEQLFPQNCVQMIQDSYAELLDVMMVITDLYGKMITRPSNIAGLFAATETSPNAHERCLEHWTAMAGDPRLQPSFERSHLGLLCARGLIRIGNEIKAMLIVGGIAPQDWPPEEDEIKKIAGFLQIDPVVIKDHVNEVHRADARQQKEMLPHVQRLADIFSFIATEHNSLVQRLDKIAELARL